jgi:hypothetical protein
MSIRCELEGEVKSTQTFENCSAQPIFRLAEIAFVIGSVETLRPLTIRLMNSEDESEDMVRAVTIWEKGLMESMFVSCRLQFTWT